MILTSHTSKIQTFPRVFWFLPKKSTKKIRIQRFCKNLWIFGFLKQLMLLSYASLLVRHEDQT